MASTAADDFENDWTFIDKDGKVDIEVSRCRFGPLQYAVAAMVLQNAISPLS